MPAKTIIEFTNLSKQFHDLIAVNNLNLEIYKGEILGFVGPNGAGKTTTMKMLGGLIKPTSGKIEIHNRNEEIIDIKKREKNFDYLMNSGYKLILTYRYILFFLINFCLIL